jgi:magnesium transporter
MAEAGLTPARGTPATGAASTRGPAGGAAPAPGRGEPLSGGPAPDRGALPDAAPPVTVTWVAPGLCQELSELPDPLPERGYAWVDAHYDPPDTWVGTVERLTGVTILDEHRSDARNPTHPSYFDSTRDYEMIVFRGLAVAPVARRSEPTRIRTRPTVFFLFPRCVVSIRPADSRQVPALRQRLLEADRFSQRLPVRPEELMLRILNGMVDRYLELRQPLTEQLESWQRALLDPRRAFSDWGALLEARRQLRKLENLSEEQLDALQEWRDERLDRRSDDDERRADWADATGGGAGPGGAAATVQPPALPALPDSLEVRVNDLVEHIERVRAHARRLESSVESAVQLHFSATAHRTSQVMRTLTVITAVFMPLTLITGIFGMNFEFLPGIHSPTGFWWTIGTMAAIALGLVAFFRARRYLTETGLRGGSGRRHPPHGEPPAD